MSKPQKKIPIGISDFKKIRENQYYYIDKTDLIHEITDSGANVLLLPRPRRFGKTLNMSMLRYFFEKSEEDRGDLFKGTGIYGTEAFQEHQGRYPVIRMNFEDMKARSYEEYREEFAGRIRALFEEHEAVLREGITDKYDLKYIQRILDGSGKRHDYEFALKYLSRYLRECSGQSAVILIDGYDTPLHTAWREEYYDDVLGFLFNFLGAGLKDNSSLFKGIITGMLWILEPSMVSSLNNVSAYTVLDRKFSTCFGFTENEVKKLLDECGIAERFDTVSQWYGSYLAGGKNIYNPLSILNFAHNRPDNFSLYWKDSIDSAETAFHLVTWDGRGIREEIGLLLEGKNIQKTVHENIVMKNLDIRDDLLWSFLLFSGYLKPVEQIDFEKWTLAIPNKEVQQIYRNLIRKWFSEKVETHQLNDMLRRLTAGNIRLFERMLRKVVLEIMSYHDLAGEPERVYHALVLGMLVWLGDAYEIRSNRESGLGRYDVMLKPNEPEKQGIIIEFKLVEDDIGEKPETTLKNALKQIEKRQYAAELKAAGVENILKLAIAFRGKELWVKQG